MRSKPEEVSAGSFFCGRILVKSCLITRISRLPEYPFRQRTMFFLMSCNASWLLSINTTNWAPRLKASSPNAPVPAKRSRTVACVTRLPRILNRASRALSEVGRMLFSCSGGVNNLRPFAMPPIILKSNCYI